MIRPGTALLAARGTEGSLWTNPWVLGGVAAVVVVAAAVVWIRRRRGNKNGPFIDPRKLFEDLCNIHSLTSQQRRTLATIARHQRLSNPARLFLELERWQDDQLGGLLKTAREDIETLRTRLCGKG